SPFSTRVVWRLVVVHMPTTQFMSFASFILHWGWAIAEVGAWTAIERTFQPANESTPPPALPGGPGRIVSRSKTFRSTKNGSSRGPANIFQPERPGTSTIAWAATES